MKRVTGIGGIFFKAKDPAKLRAWYRQHLGIESESWGGFAFQWQDDPRSANGSTIWSPFADDTKVFRSEPETFHDQLSRRRS